MKNYMTLLLRYFSIRFLCKEIYSEVFTFPYLQQLYQWLDKHCMKSVRIRSYSGPYFSAFGLNTDKNNSEYGHFSCSESKKGILFPLLNYVNFFVGLSFLLQQSPSPEVYSEPWQTSKMKRFSKIVNSYKLLTIFAKHSFLDVWQCFEYASVR